VTTTPSRYVISKKASTRSTSSMLGTKPREARSAPALGRRRESRYCSVAWARALATFRQAALGTSLASGLHKHAVGIEIPTAAVACYL
jgi:hypothetical protein